MILENYIVKGIGGFYYVHTSEGVVECKPKGIFRKKKITPVAGDCVRLEKQADAWVISEILPRKNVFVRPPIANVDQFFIVASTVQPLSLIHISVRTSVRRAGESALNMPWFTG